MLKTIPIYTANITVIPFKKVINTIKKESPITLKNIVVKGFHSTDIFERNYKRLLRYFKKDIQLELKEIVLLKQHGMGVND